MMFVDVGNVGGVKSYIIGASMSPLYMKINYIEKAWNTQLHLINQNVLSIVIP